MSEIPSDRNSSQDLRDLQETYRRRRQDVQKQGEEDVESAREEARKKLGREVQAGEAAVNHIRQNYAERAEKLNKDTEQRLTYARKNSAQKIESAKQQGEQSMESLQQSLEQKRAGLHNQTQEIVRSATDQRQREAEMTAKLQAEQHERRNEVMGQAQKEIADIHAKALGEKSKIRQSTRDEIAHEASIHQQKLEQLRNQHKQTYDKQSEWSNAQLKSQAHEDQLRIESQRQEFLRRQDALKKQSGEALKQEKDVAESRMKKINQENRDQVEMERQKGAANSEQTRNYYAKELARLHKQGDEATHNETERSREQLRLLKQEHKLENQELKTEHESELKDTDQLYKQRAQNNEIFYKQALLQQRKEFEDAHGKNQKAFEESIRLQKENLARSLQKEKKEVMDHLGKYKNLNSDPFYKMSQVDGKLRETETHYIIEANVPEHEKENVRVTFKGDRVIVQGSRKFQDRIDDQTGGVVSTQNYQTFREVIPLERPVQDKLARQFYDNGVLTISVPKV